MVLFVLISDIDKSWKSWYEWTFYNSNNKLTTDFVSELNRMGSVDIPEPNFVNFRKYADYDKNEGYGDDIYFKVEDLDFENYTDWIYNQLDKEDRKNMIVIGLEQGCHHAKFFANKYHRECRGLFILGNRILSKENYEKIKNERYYGSLKQYFGESWEKYTIDNIDNEHLKKVLDGAKNNQDYVMFLNGFIKLYTRSQYDKIKKARVPSFIYSDAKTVSETKLELDRKYKNGDDKVIFYYLDDDAPYLIYGQYKGEILERIKCFVNSLGTIKKPKSKPKKTVAKRVILLTGLSGSGKTTLGNKIKDRYSDVVIVDSDEIDDGAFLELYENNKKFRKMIQEAKGKPWEMHDKLIMKKRDAIIKKNNGKIIIFVGLTVPLDDIVHDGYFLDTPIDTNFKRVNMRTLGDVCNNREDLKALIDKEKPNAIDMLTIYKYKIRQRFPIPYGNVEKQYERRTKKAKEKGYKIMNAEQIMKDLEKILGKKGGYSEVEYKRKYMKYKAKYLKYIKEQ